MGRGQRDERHGISPEQWHRSPAWSKQTELLGNVCQDRPFWRTYLRTFEFRHSPAWAVKSITRYAANEKATNAA
jgi:hypothetical protein